MQIKRLIKKIVPSFLIKIYHYKLALSAAILYCFPSKKLTVIGVTGTSGKSTTVNFITRILEEAGNKVVSNSSIRFKVGDKEWKNELKMGMPGRFFMQSFLRKGVRAKCNYAVLEVTSEGIKQYRHKFIKFHTAVFTNLSPEHIESHGGLENYRNEKLKLFKATKNTHIVNIDDENAKYFLGTPAQKTLSFSLKQKADVKAEHINFNNGIQFSVNGTPFDINIIGHFNTYNALAAISVALCHGISLDVCKRALSKATGIPGRMEIITKEPFLVVVDYAHTPKQLELAYKSLGGKNLICVLGSCGGGRDKWKRPVLGRVAEHYCKEVVITNEDPYDEDPQEIIDQVAEGAGGRVLKMLDRKEAIKKAIELAHPNDAVVITGKGSESVMCLRDGNKIPWDDREIVRQQLKKIFTP